MKNLKRCENNSNLSKPMKRYENNNNPSKFAKRKTHEELEEFVARRNAIEAQIEEAKKKLAELEAEEKRLHFLDRAKLSAMKARKLRGVQFTPGIYADDENDYIIQLPPYDGD